ncbi:MAG: glycosyltransferase [Methanosphaera stadtmanae]|nr:glycosyltransferase [Methanosphaera stadtmanae]
MIVVNYKVSVIIPVYNAEENLENAIKSVINQTIGFENIELILIDDNSTDNSRNIIKSYQKKYPNNIVPYYSDANHGFPGYGRNVGLKLASSNYIMFLDNDDEYKEDICEKLYETITSKDVDYVGCNKITVDSISEIKQHLTYKNGTEYDDYVLIENDDILFFDSTAVWSKIFKKEIITKNNIKFLEDTHADDLAFTLDYTLKIKDMIFLKNYHGIYWKVYDDSLSHTVSTNYMDRLLYTYNYMYNSLKNANKEEYVNHYMVGKISYAILQCSYLDSSNEEFNKILDDLRTFEKKINYDINLESKWQDIINYFILNKQYDIAKILLKSLQKLRKITILRKITRNMKE